MVHYSDRQLSYILKLEQLRPSFVPSSTEQGQGGGVSAAERAVPLRRRARARRAARGAARLDAGHQAAARRVAQVRDTAETVHIVFAFGGTFFIFLNITFKINVLYII